MKIIAFIDTEVSPDLKYLQESLKPEESSILLDSRKVIDKNEVKTQQARGVFGSA